MFFVISGFFLKAEVHSSLFFKKTDRYAVVKVVALRATIKKVKGASPSASSGLLFEASNSKAVCTVAIVSGRATTAEVAETSVSATYRTTPVVTVAAHIGERTIAVVAETCKG